MTASFLKIRVKFKTYFSRDQRSFLDPNTAQRSPLLFEVPKPCFFTGSLFFNSHVLHRSRDVPKSRDKLLFNSVFVLVFILAFRFQSS